MANKRIVALLTLGCVAVGTVVCPEAGEIERDHAIGRTLLWASVTWAVLWCGWMLWRRRQQKAVGWGWILALIVPLVNVVSFGLLCLSEVATDINDSLLNDVGMLGCVFAAFPATGCPYRYPVRRQQRFCCEFPQKS